MRPAPNSRPGRGACERTSSDPNRRILRVRPVARPSAALWKMASTIRRASLPVTPPWTLRTAAARSALVNVETRSFLLLQGGGLGELYGSGGRGWTGYGRGGAGRGGAGVVGVVDIRVVWVPAALRVAQPYAVPPASGTAFLDWLSLRHPGPEGGSALTFAECSVIGAGFALPRDAGRRPALVSRSRAMPVGDRRSVVARCGGVWGTVVRPPAAGGAERRSAFPGVCAILPAGVRAETGDWFTDWFTDWLIAVRGPADRACRAEAPAGTQRWCGPHVRRAQRHRRWFRAPARCRSERPALVSRSRAMPVGDRRSVVARCEGVWGTVVRPPAAGCADRRSALPGVCAILPAGVRAETGDWFTDWFTDWLIAVRGPADRACRAEAPAGTQRWCGPHVRRAQRHRRWFRAPARCRSEAGAGFALPRDAGRRPALRCRALCGCLGYRRPPASGGRCRAEVGAPGRVRHPARGGTCRDGGHFTDWLIAVRAVLRTARAGLAMQGLAMGVSPAERAMPV